MELLAEPEVDIGFTPLVTEDPRKCFERYVQRLQAEERLLGAAECSWERLQARAAEHLQGGHVGKLEFFWILRPGSGSKASPEAADGLVCFQFVQSCAANFARVLHLSVVPGDDGAWQEVLPSAILEVRRLIFGSLPVDSIRAVVLAGEDEGGRIYVDGDVETSYLRCAFRWFQLTQNIRRTKSSYGGLSRGKKKLGSRFLVLATHRGAADPKAPRSNIGRLDPLLLRDERPSPSGDDTGNAQVSAGFASF